TDGTWLEQFAGKKTLPALGISKVDSVADNEIRAITGATISSQSVTKTVNETLAAMREKLAAAGK
ncbi:MAG: FMN-binding protein, partial [Planctomycetota bacterium]